MRALLLSSLLLVAPAAGQSVEEVLERVRESRGLAHLQQFEHGLVFRGVEAGRYGEEFEWECVSDGDRHLIVRSGRLVEREASDGADAWIRELGGETRVCELGDRTLAAVEVGILSGRFLAEGTPLEFRVEPRLSDERQVTLASPLDGGRASVAVEIDRTDWRPLRWRVEVGLRRGVVELDGENEFRGVRFPAALRFGSRSVTITDVAGAPKDESRFRLSPGVEPDHSFDPDAPADVRARTDDNERCHVRALVNGRDVGWFLLDSGSQLNLMTPEVAEALGLELFGAPEITGFMYVDHPGRFARAESLTVGPLTVRDPLFIVSEIQGENEEPEEAGETEPLVGVLGYTAFARSVIEMESDAARVSVYDPALYRLPTGEWLEMQYYYSAPVVPGSLDGRAALFRLDTGAGGGHTFDFATVRSWGLNRGTPGRPITMQGDGERRDGPTPMMWTTAAGVGLGRHVAHDVRIRLATNPVGKYSDTYTNAHMGMWFGRAFVLVFDFQNRRFAAEPPALWRRGDEPAAPERVNDPDR